MHLHLSEGKALKQPLACLLFPTKPSQLAAYRPEEETKATLSALSRIHPGFEHGNTTELIEFGGVSFVIEPTCRSCGIIFSHVKRCTKLLPRTGEKRTLTY